MFFVVSWFRRLLGFDCICDRAVAEYLSRDLPYVLSPDDVFMTLGCVQAIEVILTVLAQPGANILLPRPGFPFYEAYATHCNLEVRYFDLLPDKGWEVDLKAVENVADEYTAAMVIINPGNPCGNVFSYKHLKQVQFISIFIKMGHNRFLPLWCTALSNRYYCMFDQVLHGRVIVFVI